MFVSTRTDPVQEMKLEALREADAKMTEVEISRHNRNPDIEIE